MVNYALQEIKKRKSKYLLNILVITLIVVLIITLGSLAVAYKDAAKLPFESIHSSIIIQKNGNVPENTSGTVLSCSLAPIQSHYLAKIRGIEGVKDVSSGLFLWVFDSDNFKRVLGMNWNDSLGARVNSKLVEGRLPETEAELLVERTYAGQYGVHINQNLSISGVNFTIAGIVATSGNDVVSSDVYMNLAPAQRLAYISSNLQATERFEEDDINIIFVDAEQTQVKNVTAQLNSLLADAAAPGAGKTPTGQTIGTFTISTPDSFESQISSLFLLSDKLILMLLVVIVVGATLIIIWNMSHTVLERRKEFGIMKAVGFSSKDLQKEIVAETLVQIIIGYIGGLILSGFAVIALARTKIAVTIPWDLNPYPHFLTSAPEFTNTVQTYLLPIRFQYPYALVAFGIVAVIGILTVLLLARYLNTMKATEVLRHE